MIDLHVRITTGTHPGPYQIYYRVIHPSNFAMLLPSGLPAMNVSIAELQAGVLIRVPIDYTQIIVYNVECDNYKIGDPIIECDQTNIIFSGNTSYPIMREIGLGENYGSIDLNYNSITHPTRFILKYDGAVVIDTGYCGTMDPSLVNPERQDFKDSLAGKSDPISGTQYPDYITYIQDGYPLINPASGTISFTKTSSSPTTAWLEVYSPMESSQWEAGVTCPEIPPTEYECDDNFSFNGKTVYPEIIEYNLGLDVGYVVFEYDAFSVPDRFVVEYDGNVVIDTGYMGTSDHNYGGNMQRVGFRDSLTGREDEQRPGKFYPYSDPYAYDDIAPDGYPYVNSPGGGMVYFYKSSLSPTQCTVKVYGPTATTIWSIKIKCPIPELPGGTPTITPTSTPVGAEPATPTPEPTSEPITTADSIFLYIPNL
jgi:hypothetical protein